MSDTSGGKDPNGSKLIIALAIVSCIATVVSAYAAILGLN